MSIKHKKQRFRRRFFRHHLILALICATTVAVINYFLNGTDLNWKISMSTAYVATGLLAVTLVIGPFTRLRGRQSAVSSDLRRDIGIWCALIGTVHVVTGIQIHMGNPFLYFFIKQGFPHHLVLRSDSFGFANYTGLIATLLLLFLAILSNDRSLSILGSVRWKSFQRWNYALAALVFIHGFIYQDILNRGIPYIVLLMLTSLIVLVFQSAGYSKTKINRMEKSKQGRLK